MAAPTPLPQEIADLRSSDEALVVVNIAGDIVMMSKPAEDLFGISFDDVGGEALEILMPEEFRFGHQAYRRGYFMELADREMDPGLDPHAERPLDGTRFPIAVRLEPKELDGARYAIAHVTAR